MAKNEIIKRLDEIMDETNGGIYMTECLEKEWNELLKLINYEY